MTMDEALYLDDSYKKEFTTVVSSVKDGKFVVLKETAFYPNGGGQPNDTGMIIKDDKEYPVVFVGKFSGEISHEVECEGLSEGDEVSCTVDWKRRHKLMRMHTAAHILSAVFHKQADAKITGNQLGLDKSRIDFSLETFDREKIGNYFALANEWVSKNYPVAVSYMPRIEAEKDTSLFKLAKALPESITTLRIVSIGDIDSQADGGTHVKSTEEVGKITFLKAENKGKSNRRVYFTLL